MTMKHTAVPFLAPLASWSHHMEAVAPVVRNSWARRAALQSLQSAESLLTLVRMRALRHNVLG